MDSDVPLKLTRFIKHFVADITLVHSFHPRVCCVIVVSQEMLSQFVLVFGDLITNL
mgnify:CR=1 FL=1